MYLYTSKKMAYNEDLANKVREALAQVRKVEEKKNVSGYHFSGGW